MDSLTYILVVEVQKSIFEDECDLVHILNRIPKNKIYTNFESPNDTCVDIKIVSQNYDKKLSVISIKLMQDAHNILTLPTSEKPFN